MPADTTTFAAAFGITFGLIVASLWRLERRARALEKRLAELTKKP